MKQEFILNTFGNELTIREGKALELKEPQRIAIVGDINTVATFLTRRYAEGNQHSNSLQLVDKNKAVVMVDKTDMTIELLLDPENFYGASVKGSIELSDELLAFKINMPTTFKREELVRLLRFNRIYFESPDMHLKVLTAYQTFKAQTQTELQQSNDARGNKNLGFDKKVTTDLPTDFILRIPIFKGQDYRTFRVEICLDVTDGGARFWFESVELHEIIEVEKEAIINK